MGEMTLPAGCVGASVCSPTKITPSPLCLCLGISSEPTCGLSSVGPEWSQAWPGGWEARGQALSCRRPGDRLQASCLCPSSFGRLVSPHPANSPPLPPSPPPLPEHLCARVMWLPACPREAFSLGADSCGPQSSPWGVGPQGLLTSESQPGSGASPWPPPVSQGPYPLPSSFQLFSVHGGHPARAPWPF